MPYEWRHGNTLIETFTEAGEVTKTLQTINGCDSIVTFTLTVNPTYTDIHDGATICDTDLPYEWRHGNTLIETFTEAGEVTKTLQTINGCDSTVTFTLTVNPTYRDIQDGVSVCENALADFTWEGEHFTPTELVKTKTLTTVNNCDSIVTFIVTLLPSYTMTPKVEYINANTSYPFYGEELTTGGIHTHKLQTVGSGCDSIVAVDLRIVDNYIGHQYDTICQDSTFIWHEQPYTEEDIYPLTLQTIYGTDSIALLHLTVLTYQEVEESVSICQGETFEWEEHGEQFSRLKTEQTYYDTIRHKLGDGCDSIRYTLHLKVNKKSYHTFDTTFCTNHFVPFEWNDMEINDYSDEYNGAQVKALEPNAVGCDSIVKLNMIVNPSYVDELGTTVDLGTVYINEGTSFPFCGQNLTQSQIYKETIPTVGCGCDSTVTVDLRVMPKQYGDEYATICPGNKYPWKGSDREGEGPHQFDTLTVFGTDSVVILHLSYYSSYPDVQDGATICANELDDFIWEGEHFTLDNNVITKNLGTVNGCDSIVTFTLTILPSYPDVHDGTTICDTELAEFTWEGEHFSMGELTKTKNLGTIHDCDSIVTFTLTVHPSYPDVRDGATICANELAEFTWEGEHFTMNELTKTKNLGTINNCDSIVTFTLTVLPSYTDIQDGETICANELSSFRWEGESFTSTNLTKTKNLHTINNCDSIVTFTLTLLPAYTDVRDGETICSNELADFTWEGEHFTLDNLTKTKNLGTIHSCDSIVTFTLKVNSTTQSEKSMKIFSNQLPYTWDGITFREEHDTDTTIVLPRANANGCDSTVIRHLTVDLCIDLKADITFTNPSFCADEGDAHAMLRIHEGNPVSYSVSYPLKDRDGYLQDVSEVALPSGRNVDIVIPVTPATDKEHYLRPDDYPVDVTITDICGIRWELPRMTLRVLYPSWLIVQKWDDVLALYNERYNGGYTFSRINWYNNGLPIEGKGANNSYIYVNRGNGEMLQFGTPYWAELTRQDDGKTICTCPYLPQRIQQAPERKGIEVSFAQRGYQLLLTSEQNGTYALYDVTGKTLQTGLFNGQTGPQQIDIDRSCAAGSYLIVFRTEDGTTETRKFAIY